MGPGRTGVKGVIRDRDEFVENEREERMERIRDLNRRMEATNLGGMTFTEEEVHDRQRRELEDLQAENRGKKDWELAEEEERSREMRRISGWETMRKSRMEMRSGRFGHLREVGVANYVTAVEARGEGGCWVVVHIYDKVGSTNSFLLIRFANSHLKETRSMQTSR